MEKRLFVVLNEVVNAVPLGSKKLRHLLVLGEFLVCNAESFFDEFDIKGSCVADPNCPLEGGGQRQGKRIVPNHADWCEADIDGFPLLMGIGEQQIRVHLVSAEDVK